MKKIASFLMLFLLCAFTFAATTVSVKTASYAVTLADDNSIIIMNSASNLIVYLPSLPTDRVGFTITVQKRGAGNVTITPQAADYIADSGVGTYLRNTVAGEIWASATLTYATANRWTVTAALGTWATDTSTLGTGLTLPVAVANGGTGQSSYTNGQLLIGNTTGNTLAKAALTGTTGQVVVTNGTGTITLSKPLTETALTTGFTLAGGTTPKTITLDADMTASTVNTHVALGDGSAHGAVATNTANMIVRRGASGEIVGGTVNGLTLAAVTIGFTLAGGTTPKTLTLDVDIAASAIAPKASPSFTGTVTDLQSSEADFDINEVKSTGIPAGYGIVIVGETSKAISGVYRLEGGAVVNVSQNALFTATKDNAATINVYYETDQVKVQNKIVLGAIEAVSVVAAGADYLVNDVLTLADGTAGTVTVATIGGDAHVDAITLTTAGLGYTTGVKDTTAAPAGGTGCTVEVTAVDLVDGHVDSVSLTAGGLGYAINDVLTLAGGVGGDCTVTVTAIDKGHVTGVTLTAAGSGYSVATHTVTGGAGTGCTIAVSAIVGLVLKVAYFGIY